MWLNAPARESEKSMGLINRKPNIGALARAGDVDGLTEALRHKTEDVRKSAAFAIQDLFATAQGARIDAITKTLITKPEVTERLVAASKDSNATVRWGAIWALGFVGYVNKQVLGNIIEALNDPDHSVRGAAAVALETKKDDAALRSLTIALNKETEPHAIKAMSGALERMRNLPE